MKAWLRFGLIALLIVITGPAHLACRAVAASPLPCAGAADHADLRDVGVQAAGAEAVAIPAAHDTMQHPSPGHRRDGASCELCAFHCHNLASLQALPQAEPVHHTALPQPLRASLLLGIKVLPLPRPPDGTQ